MLHQYFWELNGPCLISDLDNFIKILVLKFNSNIFFVLQNNQERGQDGRKKEERDRHGSGQGARGEFCI